MSHYWRPDDPDHLAEAVLCDWIDALVIYPQWAIAEAVRQWNRTSGGKRPAPAHIAALCEREVQPVRDELARARSVLSRVTEATKPEPNAEQKARVAAMVASVTGKLK